MVDLSQDTTILIKGSWRFLNITYLFTNPKTTFAFDAPTVWNDLLDEFCSAPTLADLEKKLKSCLFDKAFPP